MNSQEVPFDKEYGANVVRQEGNNMTGRAVKSLILASVAIGLMTCAGSTSYAGAGAIYYSPSDGMAGVSYGYDTFAEAFRAAQNNCGGGSCRLVIWEKNQCVYLATGKNRYAFGIGYSEDEAINICSAHTTGCAMYMYTCN